MPASATRISIEPLGQQTMQAAHKLHQQATYSPWSFATFEDCTTPPYKGLVCIADGDVAGYALILNVAGEATLMDIAVDVSLRGQKIGRHLMQAVLSACENMAAEELWLEVRAGNSIALSLYQSSGFEVIETRKNYYPADNGREDAIIMRRFITAPNPPADQK